MTYHVFTSGIDEKEKEFATESQQVVEDYIKTLVSRYYDKVYVENKETSLIKHNNRDAYIREQVNNFFNRKWMYLLLISYSYIKGAYTRLHNEAISRLEVGRSYYNYVIGTIYSYKDIPKFEDFYQRCLEARYGTSGIYVRMQIKSSTPDLDLALDKINKKAYSCPEWVNEMRTKIKIEELMHKAYLRRNKGV